MNNEALRGAYVNIISHYSPHITHAVTLTFKARALINPQDFSKCNIPKNDIWGLCKRYQPQYQWNARSDLREWRYLNEEVAESTLRYFYSRLSFLAFGKDAKRISTKDFSKPLMIASIEGAATGRRLHAHLAIGNLPKNIDIRNTIERAWFSCDFANKQINITPLSNRFGWLTYISKEINLGRVDALRVQSIREPQSYLTPLA
ncbi:hypothetical protein G6699_06300 [Polynucleobacter paneuropaeus]|jgi:hypothetical protein|nr:hypothetical protein [Polynucleobacter paneuropaeus]